MPPTARFTDRQEVRLTPAQRDALKRINDATGISVSKLVRWFVDVGIHSFENQPQFKSLPRKEP